MRRLCKPHRFALRFVRSERASVAVEASLVILPFVVLVFAMIELALTLLASNTLEAATIAAGRQIRTGEFQLGTANSKGDFKSLVCANMTWLESQCTSSAYIDVRTFPSFSTLAGAAPMSGSTFNSSKTCFTTGNPTDIVLVRTYFKWKLLTPFLGEVMENMGDGSGLRLMSAATAFRNEPYNDSLPVGAKC